MGLSLSEKAAQEVLENLQERGGGLGIRLVVHASECAGMSYRLEFVDQENTGDLMYESHGARIYVDAQSLAYVEGTEIAYAQEGGIGGFSINNPNARNHCSCGESFFV